MSSPESASSESPTPESGAFAPSQETMPPPDYVELVRFLAAPFLEHPEHLKIDCEVAPNRPKIWIRLAFEGESKGRVLGRGGRNIQAIRTVLGAASQASGYTVHLEVFGAEPQGERGDRRPREGGREGGRDGGRGGGRDGRGRRDRGERGDRGDRYGSDSTSSADRPPRERPSRPVRHED